MENVEAGKKKESGRRQKTRGRREGRREGGREGERREVQARTKGVMMNGVMYLKGKEKRKRKRQMKCTNKSTQIKCAQRERERERESVCVCVCERESVCVGGISSTKDECVIPTWSVFMTSIGALDCSISLPTSSLV